MNARTLLTVLLAVACLGATGIAAAQDTTTYDAELSIEAPDYVDGEVSVDSGGDRLHYSIPHDTARIAPNNFDPDDVTRFGIEEDGASLTYNEEFGYYELDADGNEANFRAYWIVQQERQTENGTATETVRYEAILGVTAAQQYEHITAGSLEETRTAADRWEAFASEVRSVAGDDVDVEAQADLAISLLELRNNPFAALSGSFTAIAILMVTSLGGLLMLALGLSYAGWINRDLYRYYSRKRSLSSDEAGVDEKLHELDREERQTVLQNMDWQDIFDDDATARSFRDTFGETVFDGANTVSSLLLPSTLVRDRLTAMGTAGWVAVVDRAATDGGDGEAPEDAPLKNVELMLESEADSGNAGEAREIVELDPSADAFDAVVEAIDLTNAELRSFNLPDAADHAGVELETIDFDELMDELDVHELDFETTEAWGEYLHEFVDTVRTHEYTHDDGTPRTTRHVLNQFLQTSQLLSDRYGSPAWEYYSDAIEASLVSHSPTRDGREKVQTVIDGGEP